MRKINLLFTVWGMSYGGAERFVLNVAKYLDKNKYNVVVFSDNINTGPLQKDFEKCGAKVIYAKYHRFRRPGGHLKQLKEIMLDERIDIIHANDDFNMIFPLIAKPKDIKFIAHSHSTNFNFTKNVILSNIARCILPKIISEKSDMRLACGDEAGKVMFGKKHFLIIENGIEIKKFKFSNDKRMRMRKKYKIGLEDVVLLTVGRLSKEKNQSFLIDIFSEYLKLNKSSKLVIVGDGKCKQSLEDKIKNMRMQDKIFLIKAQDDVSGFYDLADMFILTSLYEGMPIVSIEAQANGLKCIFSDAVSKAADHLGNVKFLPLSFSAEKWANKINELNYERSKNSFDKLKRYDIKNNVKIVDKIYSDIARCKCSGRNL